MRLCKNKKKSYSMTEIYFIELYSNILTNYDKIRGAQIDK